MSDSASSEATGRHVSLTKSGDQAQRQNVLQLRRGLAWGEGEREETGCVVTGDEMASFP